MESERSPTSLEPLRLCGPPKTCRARPERHPALTQPILLMRPWQSSPPLLPPTRRDWPTPVVANARTDERAGCSFAWRGGCPCRMPPEHFPPHQTALSLKLHLISR